MSDASKPTLKRSYSRKRPARRPICSCGVQFSTYSATTSKCKTCRATRPSPNIRSSHPLNSPSTVRIMNVLTVQNDLLSKGYDVYTSLAPTAYGQLLIRNSDGLYLSLMVRTGYKLSTGALNIKRGDTNADILAIVINQDVVYEPPLSDL